MGRYVWPCFGAAVQQALFYIDGHSVLLYTIFLGQMHTIIFLDNRTIKFNCNDGRAL